MNSYFLLKYLHILSAVTVAGTGAGIAFFMLMASRSKHLSHVAITAKYVVLADWVFTTPAVIMQFVTGVLLMNRLGYSYSSSWFFAVIGLFIFIGFCWLPVVVIQYRLKYLTEKALVNDDISPDFAAKFARLMRWWVGLGIPAFLAILVIFWLMIAKPLNVG